MRRRPSRAEIGPAVAALLGLVGCLQGPPTSLLELATGQQDTGDGGDDDDDSPGGGSRGGNKDNGLNISGKEPLVANHIPFESACVSNKPAPRTLRRLTQAAYNNSVRDLLGNPSDAPAAADLFASDPAAYGFAAIEYNLVIGVNALSGVQSAAESAGRWGRDHATAFANCGSNTSGCLDAFVGRFGRQAFRRPLTAGEVADYRGLVANPSDLPTAVETTVAAMLQSPYFLYRSELGASDPSTGGSYVLSQHEVASELSYLFWDTTPDATLMSAADANHLASPADLVREAQRLLADPRARRPVANFFLQWLGISDLANQVHTEVDGAMLDGPTKEAMLAETRAFVSDVVFAKQGRFEDLLLADYSFISQPLGAFYRLDGTFAPAGQQVTWKSGERLPGVLGQGAWLASSSSSIEASPVLRGRALRMRFLCQAIGSPPANVPAVAEPSGDSQTLRERFSAHRTNPVCAACHDLMDPLAYPLGNFDGLGRRRVQDMEGGQPVDLDGRVNSPLVGDPADLADGAALAAYLAHSSQAAACLARHWSMYALGQLSWEQDGCTFAAAANFATSSQFNLQQLMVAITQTPSFVRRVQGS